MQEWFNKCRFVNVMQHISRSKDKNTSSSQLMQKKPFKNSTPYHDKSSEETRNRRNVLQHNKDGSQSRESEILSSMTPETSLRH
jgi:hypothetical protein